MMMRRSFLRRLGSQIALLALWLQFGLSFGHLHPDDIFPYGRFVAGEHSTVQVFALRPAEPLAPIPAHPNAAADIDCPICSTMAMVGASALPPPVSIAPPAAVAHAVFAPAASAAAAGALHPNFRSRAPPLA